MHSVSAEIIQMKRLSTHILSLLRQSDSVALPEYGYIWRFYSPARFIKAHSELLPPVFSLYFEEDELADSGQLLQSYLRKEKCSLKQAVALLDEDLSNFEKSLDSYGEASLPGIGKMKLVDDSLEFIPDFAFNPSLPHIILPAEKEAQVHREKEEVVAVSEEPATSQSDSTVVVATPPEPQETILSAVEISPVKENEPIEPSIYRIPFLTKLAKFAACFLMVVIVGITAFLPTPTSKNSSSTAAIIPIAVDNEKPVSPVADSVKEEQQPLDRSLIKDNSVNSEDSIPGAASLSSSPHAAAPSASFYAVVAAFKSESEAVKFIKAHRNKGGNFEIIKKSKLYLVTVASSNNKERFQTDMTLIRTDYPDAWILSLK